MVRKYSDPFLNRGGEMKLADGRKKNTIRKGEGVFCLSIIKFG